MPIANNLAAMRNAFEAAGVNFLIGEDGALGVLIGGVRWGAYIPGTGIYFYVPLTDLDMEPTDETELWFLLEDLAILELAGRFPRDDLDAKQIGRDNRERILGAIRGRALRYYEEGPAKPRRITAEDLNNAAMLG